MYCVLKVSEIEEMSGALSCVHVPVPEFWWLVIAFAFPIVAGKYQFCSTFASSAENQAFQPLTLPVAKGYRNVCDFLYAQ
jgi:hypothetical protein